MLYKYIFAPIYIPASGPGELFLCILASNGNFLPHISWQMSVLLHLYFLTENNFWSFIWAHNLIFLFCIGCVCVCAYLHLCIYLYLYLYVHLYICPFKVNSYRSLHSGKFSPIPIPNHPNLHYFGSVNYC